jgi:predicted Zn-dependent protease
MTMTEISVPSAGDYIKKMALAEAEEAAKQARIRLQEDAEKKALVEKLSQASVVSEEQAVQKAITIIERAVQNRLTEVQVYRFPNELCSDRGRAINQQEAGWEETLMGMPKQVYELWQKYFRDKGYRLKVEIVDFPGGLPGDVGMFFSWG